MAGLSVVPLPPGTVAGDPGGVGAGIGVFSGTKVVVGGVDVAGTGLVVGGVAGGSAGIVAGAGVTAGGEGVGPISVPGEGVVPLKSPGDTSVFGTGVVVGAVGPTGEVGSGGLTRPGSSRLGAVVGVSAAFLRRQKIQISTAISSTMAAKRMRLFCCDII